MKKYSKIMFIYDIFTEHVKFSIIMEKNYRNFGLKLIIHLKNMYYIETYF